MVEVVSLGDGSIVSPTHQLNVIGFFCPVPVAEAKKALSEYGCRPDSRSLSR